MLRAKILIVEDQHILAQDIKDMLGDSGYDVTAVVDSCETALSAAEKIRPDLVLMDIKLQGEADGTKAATLIKRKHNVPVIFLTAYTDDATLQHAKSAEPFGYIVKPIDERELLSSIELALHKHRMQAEYENLLKQRLAIEEAVARISRMLMSANQVDLQTILGLLAMVIKVDKACLGKIDPENTAAWRWFQCTNSKSEEKQTDLDCFQKWLPQLTLNQIVAIPAEAKTETQSLTNLHLGQGVQAMLIVPIQSQNNKLAGLIALTAIEKRQWSEQEVRAVRIVAELLASYWFRRTTEAALLQSEAKYRRLIDLSPDFIAIQYDGKLTFINPAGLKLIGAERPDEVIGSSIIEHVHPGSREAVSHLIKEMQNKNGTKFTSLEEKFIRLDGSVLDVEVEATSFARNGKCAIQVIARDITERNRTAHALQQQLHFANALYRIAKCIIMEDDRDTILDNMAGIVGKTLQLDRCLLYDIDFIKNQAIALCEHLNPNVPAVTQTKATYPIRHFQASAEYMRAHHRLMESHVDDVHPTIKEDGSFDVLHNDMKITSLLWYPFAFHKNDYFVLVFNQVTYRRTWQVEEIEFVKSVCNAINMAIMKLRFMKWRKQAEEKYLTLFEESKDVVFISSPEGKFLDINQAGVDLFGYPSKEDLLNVNIGDELYDSSMEREALKQTLAKNGYVKDFPSSMKKTDGTILHVQETSTAIRNEKGEIVAIRGILRDLTAQRELEDQLLQSKKMETVGTLAGGVAHDFNNLLTAILGNAAFGLKETSPNEPAHQDFLEILKAAEKATALTDQLLSFSRQKLLKKQNISINETCEDILKLIQRILGEDIELSVKLHAKQPVVTADSGQLQQVLMNLCANARDALPNGGKLTLKTDSVDGRELNFLPKEQRKKKYVKIAVTDSGEGISPEALSHIFDPFFTTKEVGKGTGLGLAVTYGIIQQHDGYIHVHSKLAVGTTFEIHLPAATEQHITTKSETQSKQVMSGYEKILVVEDDETVRNVTVRILKSLNYEIRTAANSDEAMACFTENYEDIDLVLMDVVIPTESGPEVYKKMLALRFDLPVIFVTGYEIHARIEDLKEGPQKHLVHILQKPYSRRALGKKLREVFDYPRVSS